MARAKLTPDQQRELARWFREERLTAAAALARCESRGWEIARATIYNYRAKVLGDSADQATEQMRRAAVTATATATATPSPTTEAAPVEDPAELGAVDQLEGIRRRIARLGAETDDPKVAALVARTLCDLAEQIDRMRERAGTGERPRALVFLPVRRPDPSVYDPNDPPSWPDNPYARPPLAPDPAVFPPSDPAAWPHNPYEEYPYRPYSCTCWGTQIWQPVIGQQTPGEHAERELAAAVVAWLRTLQDEDLDRAPQEVLQALTAAPSTDDGKTERPR